MAYGSKKRSCRQNQKDFFIIYFIYIFILLLEEPGKLLINPVAKINKFFFYASKKQKRNVQWGPDNAGEVKKAHVDKIKEIFFLLIILLITYFI